MKVVHPDIDIPLVKERISINETIIEKPKFLADTLLDLYELLSGNKGRYIFSKRNKPCSLSQVLFIDCLDSISVNTRTILKKSFQQIENDVVSSTDLTEFHNALSQLLKLIESFDLGFLEASPVEEISFARILDVFGMHYPLDELTLVERIADYMTIQNHLNKIELFIFFHLRSLLDTEELLGLFKHAEYSQSQIWMIESHEYPFPPDRSNYHRVIIDDDFCII